MRVLVTGPRGWTDVNLLCMTLDDVTESADDVTIISGLAVGFDLIALRWANENFPLVKKETYPLSPLDYQLFGKAAPHLRNQKMVDSGADICVAGLMRCTKKGCDSLTDHYTHGTASTLKRVREAGIPVIPLYQKVSQW